MAISIVRREEIPQVYENGFARAELLEGTYEGITNYKCFLKAGSSTRPEKFDKKIQIFCFTSGTGYVATEKRAWNIDEISFFIPNFDNDNFSIQAATDMEYLQLVVDMSDDDMANYHDTHMILPYFTNLTSAIEYTQTCKGPNTRSWYVIPTAMLARIMMGVVKAEGEGTTEPGHAHVAQWNYCLPGANFKLTVGDESVQTHDGDWSYVPAGIDHSLISKPGESTFYIWFEHFVTKKNFIVYPVE